MPSLFETAPPETTGTPTGAPKGSLFDTAPADTAHATGALFDLAPTGDHPAAHRTFWGWVGDNASRALHGAATAVTGAEDVIGRAIRTLPAPTTGGKTLGEWWDTGMQQFWNQPAPRLPAPGLHYPTAPPTGETLGQAVQKVGEGAHQLVQPAESVLANAPGFKQLGDFMRSHPQQTQDVLALINAGLNAAQVLPILGLGAAATKAAVAAAVKRLGYGAIRKAAEDAAAAGAERAAAGAAERAMVPPVAEGSFLPKPVPSRLSESLIAQQKAAGMPRVGAGLGDMLPKAGIPLPEGEIVGPKFPALQRLITQGEEGFVSPGAVSDAIAAQRSITSAARGIEEQIYKIEGQQEADRVLARQMLESPEVKSLSKADREALHHFSEDPNVPVTPVQRRAYNMAMRPMLQDINRITNYLREQDIPFEPNAYIPRQAAMYPNLAQRLGLGGTRFSKSASFLQGRTMRALEDPKTGERLVVHLGDENRVEQFIQGPDGKWKTERMGNWSRGTPKENGEVFTDQQGRDWILRDARTAEIEASSPVKYTKDSVANVTTAWLRARQIERSVKWLDAMKTDPEFARLGKNAVGARVGAIPESWVPTRLRQFTGWRFEPKVAAVLDEAAGAIEKGDAGALERLNRFLVTSIFFNPLIHVPNITVNWFVAGGMSRWLAPVRLVKTTARAINEVVHMGEDYQRLMRAGMPAEFARTQNRKFFEGIASRAIDEAAEPSVQRELSRILGSNINPIKWLYNSSSYVTWLVDDVARMQTLYELEARGLSREAALKEVDRVIPNYRISALTPGAKILNNNTLFMFNAYHVLLLRNLGGMAGKAALLSPRDIDRMLALGFWMIALQPQLDEAARQLTGEPRAHFRVPGYATPVQNWLDVAEGTKTWQQALQGTFTPSPLFTGIGETLTGRSLYSGQPIASQWQRAVDILGPARTVQQFEQSPKRGFAGLFGVSTPKLTPREARAFITDRDQAALVGQDLYRKRAQGDIAGAQREYDQFRSRVEADFNAAYDEETRLGIPHRTNPDGGEMTFDDYWTQITKAHVTLPDPSNW